MYPDIVELARADRAFLGRAVRFLVREAGVRQFLDVGTGLPTADNTHEVAQALAPCSRVVYVDNDPLVLSHAGALLVGSPEGATDYIDADARDPARILRIAAQTLDFRRPVAVMMLGVLIYVSDTDEAYRIVNQLMDPLPSGSYLVIAHSTSEVRGEATEELVRTRNKLLDPPMTLRTDQEQAPRPADDPAQRPADRALLRRPGPGGAGRSLLPPLAPRPRRHRPRPRRRRVLRRGQKTLTPPRPQALPSRPRRLPQTRGHPTPPVSPLPTPRWIQALRLI